MTPIEALAWLYSSNFSTLYPSEYARIAKECADILDEKIAGLEDDLSKAKAELTKVSLLVSRYKYPDTTGR